MVLSGSVKVPLPEKGIIVRGTGKYRYVYKVLSAFRNEAGQPTNTRKAIGRLDETGEMLIPNDAYWAFYGDTVSVSEPVTDALGFSFDSVRSIGATFLITQILSSIGAADVLNKAFGGSRAAHIIAASAYMVCRGNIFEYAADWSEGYTYREPPLTSQGSSSLFASITFEEKMAFFREWGSKQSDNEFFAYDVTSFASYSADIVDTEWGYSRDKEKPQINFGCYIGQKSGLPAFYVTYPGPIADKSHLAHMMAYNGTLGIMGTCFIMSREFCTVDNVKYMYESELSYIMGAEASHKATQSAIDAVRDGIVSMKNLVKPGVYAHSVRSRFYGLTQAMHIYFDPDMAEAQRRDRYKLEYDYEKMDDAARNCGFFCLLSNTDLTSSEALDIYMRKGTIKKGFDNLKNRIDMKRLTTHSSNTADGKMFCAFIALIAVLEMANKLSAFKKENTMSKAAIISELEKIKVVFMNDGKRLVNPLTKTQRTILNACGLSEDDLKLYLQG